VIGICGTGNAGDTATDTAGIGLVIPMINEPPPYPTMEEYRRSIGTLPDDNKEEGKGNRSTIKPPPLPAVEGDGGSLERSPDNNKEEGKGTFSIVEPTSLPAVETDKQSPETLPDDATGAKE